jgi:hypothetical protein
MFLDELGNLGYLTVVEDTAVLEYRIAILLDKELGGTALGELAVAGMYMHTLDDAERGEIKVIACNLEIVILRHRSVLHVL